MFRNLTSIMALTALLATAACSNITGPSMDQNANRSKVELAPPSDDPGQGSGGKDEPIVGQPRTGRSAGGDLSGSEKVELAPPSDDPGQGSGGKDEPIVGQPRTGRSAGGDLSGSEKVELAPPSEDPGQGSGGKEDLIPVHSHASGARRGQQHTP